MLQNRCQLKVSFSSVILCTKAREVLQLELFNAEKGAQKEKQMEDCIFNQSGVH